MKAIRLLSSLFVMLNVITTTNAADENYNLNGLDIKVQICRPYGDGVLVRFDLKNTTSTDLRLNIDNLFPDRSYLVTEEGASFRLTVFAVNGNRATDGNVTIPAELKVTGLAMFRNVPYAIKPLKRVVIKTRVGRVSARAEERVLTFNDVQTTNPGNTNLPNLIMTEYDVTVKSKPLVRSERNVELPFVLTNTDKSAYRQRFTKPTVYDSEGNTYEAYIEGGSTFTLEPEIPIAKKLIIKNVPMSVESFTLIRIGIDDGWGNKLEWKNVEITKEQ